MRQLAYVLEHSRLVVVVLMVLGHWCPFCSSGVSKSAEAGVQHGSNELPMPIDWTELLFSTCTHSFCSKSFRARHKLARHCLLSFYSISVSGNHATICTSFYDVIVKLSVISCQLCRFLDNRLHLKGFILSAKGKLAVVIISHRHFSLKQMSWFVFETPSHFYFICTFKFSLFTVSHLHFDSTLAYQ